MTAVCVSPLRCAVTVETFWEGEHVAGNGRRAGVGAAAEDGGEDSTVWWQHPTIVAAVIAGVFGIPAVVFTYLATRDSGDDVGTETVVSGVEAALDSEVREFDLRCPTTIVFDGLISVTGGSGDVAYRFVHVDAFGAAEMKEAVHSVSFDGAGTAPVRMEWTPTVPEGEVFRTAAIEVLEPVSARSNEVTVRGRCDSTLPDGPPVPPPDVEPPGG
jgi:hypothetical protein